MKGSCLLFERKKLASTLWLACRLLLRILTFTPKTVTPKILNLNYAVDDGRFVYSSKLEEQISFQALPAWGLNSNLKRGLKLSIVFKKPHVEGTKRKKRRIATERSLDPEVTDNGKCQSSLSASLKNKRKGISGKMRSHILPTYHPWYSRVHWSYSRVHWSSMPYLSHNETSSPKTTVFVI